MGMQIGDKGELQSEINVTPLVDVVLVLLIIFMVIVPLTLRGYDLDIPGESVASTATDEPPVEQMVLAIDATGCPVVRPMETPGLPEGCLVRLNEDEIPVADLHGKIAAIFTERAPEDRVLFLAAQEDLNYEGVMRIVDTAKSAVDGLRIGLVTERRPT